MVLKCTPSQNVTILWPLKIWNRMKGLLRKLEIGMWKVPFRQFGVMTSGHSNRASLEDFGHFHRWNFIQIIFSNLGNWFTSLFPQWKLIPRGIPSIGKLILRAISTFGHWLQVWFPSVEINSYNYFQTFLQEIDLFLNSQYWELIH